MLTGDNPGAGTACQAPAASPECFVQVQSRPDVPNLFVGSGAMLALTCLALITPTLLHWAPASLEVAEGIVPISFSIFIVQCMALNLIYSLIQTVG